MVEFDRITQKPDVMGGKACIRGLRVTVGMIVGQIGAGRTIEQLLADIPYLEREDILQALRYAAWRAEDSSPEAIGPQVLSALRQLASELDAGALVTVEPARSRVRLLPLPNQDDAP